MCSYRPQATVQCSLQIMYVYIHMFDVQVAKLADLLIRALSDAGDVHILTNPVDDKHHVADGRQPVLARGWLLVAPNKLRSSKVSSTFPKFLT